MNQIRIMVPNINYASDEDYKSASEDKTSGSEYIPSDNEGINNLQSVSNTSTSNILDDTNDNFGKIKRQADNSISIKTWSLWTL